MLRNMACSLILTERDDMYYEGLKQADGKTDVNAPAYKGRIVTTIHKAKEVRPLVEKCITIAKKALPFEEKAAEFAVDADRNSEEWRQWRKSEKWQQWCEARAPAVNARRRAFQILRDNEAVAILFEDIAPRFADRVGGYTRIMRLAKPRLGDAGTRAILEFVGQNDRVKAKEAQKPSFSDDTGSDAADDQVTEKEEAADDAPITSPAGLGTDDLKVVEGIGPKVEEALKAAGIATWSDLADSDPDKITEILTAADGNFGGQVAETWPKQARMAVDQKWDELQKWQDELDGGKEA
jgi:large subunit ribosomal protein L17